MVKTFYFFRHGETELNHQQRWQGSGMDYELNAAGKAQAADLALKLEGKRLEIIFTSPLVRARQTAEAVAQHLNLPVMERANLRECFYGAAEGQLISDLKRNYPGVVENWTRPDEAFWALRFPQGESKGEVLKRVWAEIEELANQPHKVMGLAIHGGTMAILLNYLGFDFDKIANCAVFRMDYESGKGKVVGNIF